MKKFKKKVSIIVRGKNESRWLRILLREIKKQSENNYEIIFCDNSSTDITKDILKFYKINKIVNIKNYKPGLALNRGVSIAEGEYVVFISAHCIPVEKNWLRNFVDYMDKNKNLSAAYGKQIPLPGSNSQNTLDLNILFRDEEIIHTHDPYINNANSIYRNHLLKKNKFNQSISNIEDRVWAKDEVKRGGKIGYIANAVVFHLHGVHQHSVSTNRSIKTNLIINKDISKIWNNCSFTKPDYFNYSIIVNARREKKIINLENKIKKLKKFFLKKKCKVLNIYLITDLNIKKIKGVYKIKPNNIPSKDLNFIYSKYRKNWIETNYLVSLNSSICWNYKKIFNLIKNTIYLSKPSGTFYEEFNGNFIIDFPDNSNFKSISLIQKKDKPKIKLMKWSNGCIFDPDYLRRETYIDDETLMITF